MGIFKATSTLVAGGMLAGLLAAAPAAAAPVNLVVNGDFETVGTFTPDLPGAAYQYVGDKSNSRPANGGTSPALFGWETHTVQRGIILFQNGYQPVAGGNYAIQFENYTDNIAQTIQTVAGHTYELSYDLSAYQAPGETWPSQVQIRLNGAVVDYSSVVSSNSFVQEQFTFTAAGTTRLEIWSLGAYPQIDNISVVDTAQVPEPATGSLLGLAIMGAAFARRRRQS